MASLYYQHLTPYMDALFRLTTASVDREEEVAVRAIEFWNVICEVRSLDGPPFPCGRPPSHGRCGCVHVQVEIAIVNGQVDVVSMKYATAALSVLVPLTTSCMLKQVGWSPIAPPLPFLACSAARPAKAPWLTTPPSSTFPPSPSLPPLSHSLASVHSASVGRLR